MLMLPLPSSTLHPLPPHNHTLPTSLPQPSTPSQPPPTHLSLLLLPLQQFHCMLVLPLPSSTLYPLTTTPYPPPFLNPPSPHSCRSGPGTDSLWSDSRQPLDTWRLHSPCSPWPHPSSKMEWRFHPLPTLAFMLVLPLPSSTLHPLTATPTHLPSSTPSQPHPNLQHYHCVPPPFSIPSRPHPNPQHYHCMLCSPSLLHPLTATP